MNVNRFRTIEPYANPCVSVEASPLWERELNPCVSARHVPFKKGDRERGAVAAKTVPFEKRGRFDAVKTGVFEIKARRNSRANPPVSLSRQVPFGKGS